MEIVMKRFIAATALASSALFSASVFAHHPAEAIVSDEIWEMVNTQLEEADSPHLTMDFSSMDRMVVTDIVGTDAEIDGILNAVNTLDTDNTITVISEDLGDGMTEIVIIENVESAAANDSAPQAPAR
jgi:hypothetical protein